MVKCTITSDQVGDDLDGWYNIHATKDVNGLDIYVNGVLLYNNLTTNIEVSGGILGLGGLSCRR